MSKIRKAVTGTVLAGAMLAAGTTTATADTKVWDRGPFDTAAACQSIRDAEAAENAGEPRIRIGGCWEHPGGVGYYFSVWVTD